MIPTAISVCHEPIDDNTCFQTGTPFCPLATSASYSLRARANSSVKIGRLFEMARKEHLRPHCQRRKLACDLLDRYVESVVGTHGGRSVARREVDLLRGGLQFDKLTLQCIDLADVLRLIHLRRLRHDLLQPHDLGFERRDALLCGRRIPAPRRRSRRRLLRVPDGCYP